MSRIFLTAGFDRAKNVLILAEMLNRVGFSICGVIVVTPFSVKRLYKYLQQRRLSFLWDAARRLTGMGSRSGLEPDDLSQLWDREKPSASSLRRWCGQNGAPYLSVESLNDDEAVEFLACARPDFVVYGGGGILRKAFLEAANQKVLNAHAGPLPEIRGMNACEWSIVLGYDPEVTIHYIDEGIDTGETLLRVPIKQRPGDTIESLRSRSVAAGVIGLFRVLTTPESSTSLSNSRASSGLSRQCFVMAPALRDVLKHRLKLGERGFSGESWFAEVSSVV